MNLNTACSLFSGCGGDTLGMENADIKVKIYSEIQKVFQALRDSPPGRQLPCHIACRHIRKNRAGFAESEIN